MPERRTNPMISRQAPATGRELAGDWKLEAACAEYTGPVMDIPTSLCAVCPIRTQCETLYVGMQAELDEDQTAHATRQYLGGVWGGEARREARHQVRFGSVPIEPCGDECDAPRHARGACRNHYNKQHKANREKFNITPQPPRLCDVEGCSEGHDSRGMCAHHYYKWRIAQADLGIDLERPEPTRSSKPIDEATYAGWARAKRAGVETTVKQDAAHAAYVRAAWLEKKERAA